MPTLSGFQHHEGPAPIRRTSVVASQAFDNGDVIKLSNPGTVDEMTVSTSGDTHKGVYHDKPIASTDSDYASIKEDREYIAIINGPLQLWKANVETGTADQTTDVGYEADLASADGLTLDASTNDDFVVTAVEDSGTVIGYFK